MGKTITLFPGEVKHVLNYDGLEPVPITLRHYEYIKEAKELRKKSESTLCTECSMMLYLFSFLDLQQITSLHQFSYEHLRVFTAYLSTRQTKRGKRLSLSSQRLVYSFFKSFASWLHFTYPKEAPPLEIFRRSPYKGVNQELKTSFFSDDVMRQIREALRREEDIYTQTYILLLLYYGLRSKDIITLKSNCLNPSDKANRYDLHYIDHKQQEEVLLPAIEPVVAAAIQRLNAHTQAYQRELKRQRIFIKKKRNGELVVLKPYQQSRLNRFVKQHTITYQDGTLIKMTSHMFRRTLATNMQTYGASLESTQVLLNHKHKRTTMKHYIKTKEDAYIQQIGDIESYAVD